VKVPRREEEFACNTIYFVFLECFSNCLWNSEVLMVEDFEIDQATHEMNSLMTLLKSMVKLLQQIGYIWAGWLLFSLWFLIMSELILSTHAERFKDDEIFNILFSVKGSYT